MKPVILFRASLAEENELAIAKKYFSVIEQRVHAEEHDLVIGRYSTLPYYIELEKDIQLKNASLINTHSQYQYIADIQNWYEDLADLTPKTWFQVSDVPADQQGSFILKGATNSRKQLWKTHCFARDRQDVMRVFNNLLDDSLISHQGIYVRQYVPLMNYGTGVYNINEMPVSKEFRVFVFNGDIVAKGFYWSNHIDDINPKPDPEEVPESFLKEVINRIGDKNLFYTIDVAQTKEGNWIVIELNDGCMAGLSCIDPKEFYSKLSVLANEFIRA